MGKLEPIEGKQTAWCGLWWHPEYNGFSSEVLSLADLRKFKGKVRLYVRKNRMYEGGKNGRPNYCFTLRDANAEVFNALEVEDYEDKKLFSRKELQDLINKVACYVGGECWFNECLVKDYVEWS